MKTNFFTVKKKLLKDKMTKLKAQKDICNTEDRQNIHVINI